MLPIILIGKYIMAKIRNPKFIRYDLEIPELKKTISYRAMKVGEQKALLTAIEMKDPRSIINSVVDIIWHIVTGKQIGRAHV